MAVLDNIRSAHNVGSMFRSADAAGVGKLYLCGITPEPVDRFENIRPEFAKTALGAEETVPWEKAARTGSCVKRLKREGWTVCVLEQNKSALHYAKAIPRLRKSNMIAVVVGNEVSGVSRAVLAEADYILEIPMRGKKESLNVAVAFGVMVFALRDSL